MMEAGSTLNRYTLLELISESPALHPGEFPVALWRGHDNTLERFVSLRILHTTDRRIPAVLGAAQAAAMVDDRRLLRILDVLDEDQATDTGTDSYTVIVGEWCSGKSLDQVIAERDGTPLTPERALTIVTEVAWSLSTALKANLEHGRLRPSCIFITESDEVLIRGLAVDSAIFGPLFPLGSSTDSRSDDVHALGSLLYAGTTGLWPYPVGSKREPAEVSEVVRLPTTPRAGKGVPLPSNVRANIPRSIDILVGRSVSGVARGRGLTPISDAQGFANAIASTLDHVTPTATVAVPDMPVHRAGASRANYIKRSLGVLISGAAIFGMIFAGSLLLSSNGSADTEIISDGSDSESVEQILLSPATPFVEIQTGDGGETSVPIVSARSFDPRGGGSNPDGVLGTERENLASLAIDSDIVTGWTTRKYPTATLGKKGGVGLIVDLGEEVSVQAVSLGLLGYGTDLQVRVSNTINSDPDLWTKLVSIDNAGPQIELRAPRPVDGRYVLIWLTGIPPTENGKKFQGGITNVTVFGEPVAND